MFRKKAMLLCVYIIVMAAGVFMALRSDWYGFGVDSEGRVYIGKKTTIVALEMGQPAYEIEVPPHRAYYFTVLPDDTVQVATNSYVFLLDANGTVLSEEKEIESVTLRRLQWLTETENADGQKYTCRSVLGRRSIGRSDGKVVYEEPLGKYLQRIALAVCQVIWWSIFFLFAWGHIHKKDKPTAPEPWWNNHPGKG